MAEAGLSAIHRTRGISHNVKEFARKAEISLSLAYLLIAEGSIPHRRVGQKGKRGKIVITEDDLKAFLQSVKVER